MIFTRSGVQTPSSSKTMLSKFTRPSEMPPNIVFSSWHIVAGFVTDNDDFCLPADSRPSVVKVQDQNMSTTATRFKHSKGLVLHRFYVCIQTQVAFSRFNSVIHWAQKSLKIPKDCGSCSLTSR